jgi:hypothetical protein
MARIGFLAALRALLLSASWLQHDSFSVETEAMGAVDIGPVGAEVVISACIAPELERFYGG